LAAQLLFRGVEAEEALEVFWGREAIVVAVAVDERFCELHKKMLRVVQSVAVM
jgi:hypothetical protein